MDVCLVASCRRSTAPKQLGRNFRTLPQRVNRNVPKPTCADRKQGIRFLNPKPLTNGCESGPVFMAFAWGVSLSGITNGVRVLKNRHIWGRAVPPPKECCRISRLILRVEN